MSISLRGLAQAVGQPSFRNVNQNSAFAPPASWGPNTPSQQGLIDATPQGNTNFDPLLGTGWDRELDMAGAKQPGGIRMGSPRGVASPFPASDVPLGQQSPEDWAAGLAASPLSGKPVGKWTR